jgi:hypothetical protein
MSRRHDGLREEYSVVKEHVGALLECANDQVFGLDVEVTVMIGGDLIP